MLFDLEHTGHHANYIKYLIQYWGKNKLTGELFVLVSPLFKRKHSEIVDLVACYPESSIEIVSISEAEAEAMAANDTIAARPLRRIKEWNLMCKYASSLHIDRCIILYLDTCELPFILGLKAPCLISGIYFRPTFHYPLFQGYQLSRSDRFKHWRERFFVKRVIDHPQLETLFCLDPLVDQSIKRIYPDANVIPLADPVDFSDTGHLDPEALRKNHNIPSERRILLLFGAITERKGIYKLLEAIARISPENCRRLCILIVGAISDAERQVLVPQIELICRGQPVQIVTHFEFVSQAEVQAYFHLTDIVLAVYQHHVGMSGILLLAAAANKPVLSSNYGLMGELVRQFELGVSVDSASAQEISDAITQLLHLDKPVHSAEKSRAFAKMNSAEKFSQTLFNHTYSQSSNY